MVENQLGGLPVSTVRMPEFGICHCGGRRDIKPGVGDGPTIGTCRACETDGYLYPVRPAGVPHLEND